MSSTVLDFEKFKHCFTVVLKYYKIQYIAQDSAATGEEAGVQRVVA